jgi:H+-transporting ATPase
LVLPPTGGFYALIVWGYAIAAFALASTIKVAVYRLLDHRAAGHLHRIEENVAT